MTRPFMDWDTAYSTDIRTLGHCIQHGHPDPGRQIDLRLGGRIDSGRPELRVDGIHGTGNIDRNTADSEIFYKLTAVRNVALRSIGHQNTDDPIPSQCFHTQGGTNRTVLAAGNADDRVTVPSIFLKPCSDPDDQGFFCFLGAKFHISSYDASMVEIPSVISSSTSSNTRTVSSAVSMVTPFSTAQRRIWLEPE